ncbi:MAG TPA: tetratricopeptide repeat protein, partial [Hyphomicrobiaceae bacterium]|nr:tetratricopeptide repeat protein [Hyphomicrobiaceae bacterium]
MKRPGLASNAEQVGRALAHLQSGRLKDAERIVKDVLRASPGHFDALHALAIIRGQQRQTNEAVKLLAKAVQVEPSSAPAHYNLGSALMILKRFDEAAVAFERAVTLRPDAAHAHESLGRARQALGRLDEAAASYENAVRLDPNNSLALSSLVQAKRKICDWYGLDALEQRLIKSVAEKKRPVEPLLLHYVADDPRLQRDNAVLYFRDFLKPSFSAPLASTRFQHKPRSRERIRLGYLSSDFRQHAMAYVMAELFELHDRRQFEVIGISYGPDDKSAMRKRLGSAFDRFLDVRSASADQIARRMWSLEIDIAIDLNGYTALARPDILAPRPAPVQCQYLGFPGTLGSDFIDYLFVDPIVAPADQDQNFTERLVRLPDCYQVNDRQRAVAPQLPSRAECGLPSDGFVFCCFNSPHKLTPRMFNVWAKILHAVPESVLWLICDDHRGRNNLIRESNARGLGPDHLVFAGRVSQPEHLARLQLADLFLDTLPYNAHVTASDALWVGLPVLTCAGRAMPGRVGASLLMAVGLPELV